MRRVVLSTLLLCIIGTALTGSAASQSEGFVRFTPQQVQWRELPGSFGVRVATIAGDPAGYGLYVQRVRFPPHVMDRPHWHPNDRYVTVLEGTWATGTGAAFEPRQAVPLPPGSFMLHPAKALHWDGSASDGEVIVQVFGMGPADTVPADPQQPLWVRVAP